MPGVPGPTCNGDNDTGQYIPMFSCIPSIKDVYLELQAHAPRSPTAYSYIIPVVLCDVIVGLSYQLVAQYLLFYACQQSSFFYSNYPGIYALLYSGIF